MHCVDAVRSGRVQGGCEARSLCIVLLLLGLEGFKAAVRLGLYALCCCC